MIRLKKLSFYNFFPLFSIVSLFFIRFIELDYPTREAQMFRWYLYFNMLFPSFYLFLVAYLVPLFISLKCAKNVTRILKLCCFLLIVAYIVVSLSFFLIKKDPDLLPQKIDIMIGVLGGVLLGVASTSSDELS
ncbi:hypothetical protein [Pseudolactococcus reticulitermitis]|uniref:Uncharacterized protein n=1 Tax=Pseudolactococcus reticulitermitis TaxID=2025039 RepID=A0A224X270_9LACT|nr:hypothetical protein [Lactococcus reticulitermitis]GAX48259.1 hypothetical protein RsY01_1874 [Lactococcus reticulitermitis]